MHASLLSHSRKLQRRYPARYQRRSDGPSQSHWRTGTAANVTSFQKLTVFLASGPAQWPAQNIHSAKIS